MPIREGILQATDRVAEQLIRDILATHGKLSVQPATLKATDDLYQVGLSSLATVNVMLEIENRAGVVIPDEALTRATFQTITSLTALLQHLGGQGGA